MRRGQMVATWLRKLGACPFLNLVSTKAPHGDSEQVCVCLLYLAVGRLVGLAGRLHEANVQEPLPRLLTHAYGLLALPALPCFNTTFVCEKDMCPCPEPGPSFAKLPFHALILD